MRLHDEQHRLTRYLPESAERSTTATAPDHERHPELRLARTPRHPHTPLNPPLTYDRPATPLPPPPAYAGTRISAATATRARGLVEAT
jgi:hypothetical protein